MQSCPKNVHTGPLTGDSKGPGPQESLFVLPTAAAAALPGETGSPLAPGHPTSPARGSSGGPAAAQGPSPSVEEEQITTPPAWVTAEPTPPPSDDSSAPRNSFFFLDQVDNNTIDVNQNYNRKRKLTSSSAGSVKKSKVCETPTLPPAHQKYDHLNNNNNNCAPSNLNEPLLITTTMLADASIAGQFDSMKMLHMKSSAPLMGNLPLTPPNSSDTSPAISSTGPKTKAAKCKAAKSEEAKLKKVQRKLSALSPSKEKKEAKFELFSRSLESPVSEILTIPKICKKLKCPEPSAPSPDVKELLLSSVVDEEPIKLEIGKKVRKKSGQNVNPAPKKSKKLSATSTLVDDKLVEEMAPSELAKGGILKKSPFAPKWSNGWSWEGEPYQAKVFLRVSHAWTIAFLVQKIRNCNRMSRSWNRNLFMTQFDACALTL